MVQKSQGQVSYGGTSRFVHTLGFVRQEKCFESVHVGACLCRMDQVIVHVGCMSLKESQELVSHIFIHCVFQQVRINTSPLHRIEFCLIMLAWLHYPGCRKVREKKGGAKRASSSCKRTSPTDILADFLFAVFSSNLEVHLLETSRVFGLYIHICPCWVVFLKLQGKKNNFTIRTRHVCKLLWPKMCWCDHSVAAEFKELRFLFFQARHAAQIGASGIAVISPSFYKPSSAGRNHGKAHLNRNMGPTGSQGCHTST